MQRRSDTTRKGGNGRALAAALLLGLCVGTGSAAFAQSAGGVPIQHDLRREQAIERKAEETGSIRKAPEPVQSDPTGVAGFSGPPGIGGDSVNSYGPLPPGAPGNEEQW